MRRIPKLAQTIPTASLALAIATVGAAHAAAWDEPTLTGGLEEVSDFGENPSGLRMYKYVPEPAPEGPAPLVVVLHGCTQTASAMVGTGWNDLADELGFYVIYPEQIADNNPALCFNWAGEYGDTTNLRRGEGENLSMMSMVNYMKDGFPIDAGRVFVSGFSGGGAQAALMAALWPDVFAGASMFAGIPYHCATDLTSTSECVFSGRVRSPEEWGDLVRDAFPEYEGPYPKISIWQGSADFLVSTVNFDELIKQWTSVHGLDQTPDVSGELDGYPRDEYHDEAGNPVIEAVSVTGMGHGQPIAPAEGCGQAGAYILDAGTCGSRRAAEFFELTADGGGTPGEPGDPGEGGEPTVAIASPQDGDTVGGTVVVVVEASDDDGIDEVELYVGGALHATVREAPFEIAWATDGFPEGSYSLMALARNAAGNEATDEITVIVGEGGDHPGDPDDPGDPGFGGCRAAPGAGAGPAPAAALLLFAAACALGQRRRRGQNSRA